MKRIFTYYLRPSYLRMTAGFIIKFLGTVMDLLLPWTLAYMIDTVIPANRRGDILLWGLFMVGCSIPVSYTHLNVHLGVGDYAPSKYDPKVYQFDLVTVGENTIIPDNVNVGKNTTIV